MTGPVVVDSRQAVPGGLFVALPGTRADGHDHAGEAVAAGAVAVLAARELDVPCLVVPSRDASEGQLEALGALARHVVGALPGLVVVGVTGSSGKTSTKDLLAVLLGDLGPTVAPQGSFNNEIGLPLTALRCDASTRFLVAEMGARMPGNIAYLTRVTPPDYAVVLNVGAAHAGVFGSREATAATKGELPEALGEGGVAVLNADDPLVAAMAARTRGRVVRFGLGPGADVRAVDVRLDPWSRPSFTLVSPTGDEACVSLPLYGQHHVANALAAAAVALEAGLPAARIAELLGSAVPASRWRMELHTRSDGVTVVNDAYNANPDSVRAALKALAVMGRPQPDSSGSPTPPKRRTWAVLGEMLELGDTSMAEHDAVGRLAVRLDISRLVAVGAGARALHTGASQEGSWGEESAWVPDAAAALALLRAELAPGDVVLVKASRSAGLDVVATALLDDVPEPNVPGQGGRGGIDA